MALHSLDREPHHFPRLHAEHRNTARNDLTAASCGEPLVLEFFLERFHLHAVESLRAHPCIGMYDSRQLVDGKEAALHITLRLVLLRCNAVAM